MIGRKLKTAVGWLAGLGLALALAASGARAQALVADLSSHLIAITTGFTGTEVVLFGAVNGPGEVAVVVQGPESEVVVRRKARVAGIWMNTESLRFERVPNYYAVAVSRPLAGLLSEAALDRHEIGTDHIAMQPAKTANPAEIRAFREALIRNKQEEGLYASTVGQVLFLGERLFRTTIYFPANVPTGAYTVSVYLIRDGDVVSAQTTPLAVSKIGFSADIFDFAIRNSVYYGLAAVAFAVTAGWLAGAIFRRV